MPIYIAKRPENEKMTFVQGVLSNKLHRLASRTALSTAGRIEYWKTYIGYLEEYKTRMGCTGRPDIEGRCDATILTLEENIVELQKEFMSVM